MQISTFQYKAPLAQLAERSFVIRAAVILVGSLLLAASSQIEVPFIPVPMTMQTFAVLFIGSVGGCRLGTQTIAVWLGEAAIGLPFLAGGTGGLAVFMGPTAGYLFGFLCAAAAVGWLVEQYGGRNLFALIASLLAGEVILMAMGGAWLCYLFGASVAWTSGIAPFLLGDALKICLAAGFTIASWRLKIDGPKG